MKKLLLLLPFMVVMAQPPMLSPEAAEALAAATAEDHRDMMRQLGITVLRPGPSGRDGAPNAANYDETKANPFPEYPAVLTLKNGKQVTSAKMWTEKRRPEIVEEFDREVLGRVPKNGPKVAWTVTQTVETTVGKLPVVAKQLSGRLDNSAFPEVSVEIQMVVVTPAAATGPVPVMMMFGRAALPGAPLPAGMRMPPP